MRKRFINSVNGSLQISDNLVISNKSNAAHIITFFGQENVSTRNLGNRWIHYTTWNFKKDNRYFIFTFIFNNDVLKMIDIIVDEKIILAGSWDDWNQAEELKKIDFFEKWLTEQLGNTRQFSWGSVGAYYDQLGGSSSISLKYL